MSESELKRRIYEYNESSKDEMMETGRIVLAICDFEAIIDEAKADFPNIDSEKYGSDSRPWEPWNYSAFNRDLMDWYLKWFGKK